MLSIQISINISNTYIYKIQYTNKKYTNKKYTYNTIYTRQYHLFSDTNSNTPKYYQIAKLITGTIFGCKCNECFPY